MSEAPDHPARGAPPQFRFLGLAGDFFLLQLLNLLLSIVTLGIWRFWGKTRNRRFLWRNTLLGEDALEYRGTGVELLIGAILAVLLISLPLGMMSIGLPLLFGRGSGAALIAQPVLLLFVWYIISVGTYRSWRYLLSRTAWRGIRAGMTEQGWRFGLYNFGLLLAQALSLGLATPWVGVRRWNRLVRDVRVGSLPMAGHARARALYPSFLLAWGVVIVLLAGAIAAIGVSAAGAGFGSATPPSPARLLAIVGIGYAAMFGILFVGALFFARYHAAFLRETYGATQVGETMRLRFDVTTGQVIVYYLVNMALLLFTLGLGLLLLPWRRWSFHLDRLRIDGIFDEDAIRQTDLAAPMQGDGIADAFDLAPF